MQARALTTTAPYLRLMTDNDDRDEARNTPTVSAPPPLPSEPPTQIEASERPAIPPPGAIPQGAGQRPKGASQHPSEFFERAYEKLIEVHGEQQARDRDLLDADGKFARLVSGIIDRSLTGFALTLEPRFAGILRQIADIKEEARHASALAADAMKLVRELEEKLAREAQRPEAPPG
jgi:hypothetical protein